MDEDLDTDSYNEQENAFMQKNYQILKNIRGNAANNTNNSSLPSNFQPLSPSFTSQLYPSNYFLQQQNQQHFYQLSPQTTSTPLRTTPRVNTSLRTITLKPRNTDLESQLSPPIVTSRENNSNEGMNDGEKKVQGITESHDIMEYDEVLIEHVNSYIIIWKISGKSHKETERRSYAWREIVEKMKYFDEDSLKARWVSLRENMRKCLKRLEQVNKSGSKSTKTPKCRCFDQLLFLKDQLSSSPDTASNISLISDTNDRMIDASNEEGRFSMNASLNASTLPAKPSIVKSKPTAGPSKQTGGKRKQEKQQDCVDNMLIDALKQSGEPKVTKVEDSSDMLFCKSIAPILGKLPRKKNRKARIQIQQILMDIESDSE